MKRLMIVCIVMAAIALISTPLFAEVQNVKVSGDVNSAGVYRNNYDLMSTNQTTAGNDDSRDNSFLYTQARVRVDADLTDNVSTTVRLLSEYDWATEDVAGAQDELLVDLANVTLREVFYSPLSVTVGRQELRYGNAFILGDPDTNAAVTDNDLSAEDLSLRKSFDAVKAVFDYDPLVVDVIYAKIDETAAQMNATPETVSGNDEDLYGINVAYDFGVNNAEMEGYWFLKRDNDLDQYTAAADTTSGGHEIYTIGVRGSVEPIDNWNLLGEIAWQIGEFDKRTDESDPLRVTRDQDALAFQVGTDYTFPDVSIPWTPVTIMEPMLKLGWTHYSGEGVNNEGDHEAWIPLYEDQSHGVIANYVLGGVNGGQNSNADILNVGGSIVPLEDMNLSVDFYCFWLDERLVEEDNGMPNADLDGTATALGWTNLTVGNYYMTTDDELGYEIDLALNYDYTEDVKMGLSWGWFRPGDAFDGATATVSNDESATQILATLDVAF